MRQYGKWHFTVSARRDYKLGVYAATVGLTPKVALGQLIDLVGDAAIEGKTIALLIEDEEVVLGAWRT